MNLAPSFPILLPSKSISTRDLFSCIHDKKRAGKTIRISDASDLSRLLLRLILRDENFAYTTDHKRQNATVILGSILSLWSVVCIFFVSLGQLDLYFFFPVCGMFDVAGQQRKQTEGARVRVQ